MSPEPNIAPNKEPPTQTEEDLVLEEENADASLGENPSVSEKKKKPKKSKDVFVGKDIEVLYNEPLTHLDKSKIKAYRAIGKNKVNSELVAFICTKSLTPRRLSTIKYHKIANPNLAKLVTSEKIYWPIDKQEHFCFIYENIFGKPIWSDPNKHPALGWKPEIVLESIALPIISILMDLRNKDLVHGEIWPGNMFLSSVGNIKIQAGEKIKLGECLSAPCSYQLPALYEPIERALASPIGRGPGLISDDLYSFGVSLAVIMRTHDHLQGLSDEEIIERKVEKGSYFTLLGKDRISGAMLELLRGLLYDDPTQRWTLEDVEAWIDGRRLSPKQAPKRVKATRPLLLNNKKYIRPELLAKDIWRHADEFAKLVENGEFEQWIERAIEDKIMKARMTQLYKDIERYDRSIGYHERLSVFIATTLYMDCPVRYKNLSFIPTGFGKALSEAYVLKHDLQPFVEVLRHNFVIQSIRNRKKIIDGSSLASKFDGCKSLIGQTSIGSGLERCVYLLDNECPCLSPILEKHYVQTPEEMIESFEDICESGNPPILFDRHIAAFLSVKDRKNIDPYLSDLNSGKKHQRVLAQIRILATIQKRSSLGKFPALLDWICNHLDPIYERFHDDKKRKELQKMVSSVRKSGDLTRLALIFDESKLYQNDINAFHQAMTEYARIEYERELIEEKLKTRKNYGQKTGRQIASVISMMISILIIVISASAPMFKG